MSNVTDAEDPAAALRRANALCEQGRYDEAVQAASRVIALDPRSPWGWCAMAVAQLGLNEPKRALQAARAGSVQEPEAERPYRLASVALGQLGREEEAIEAAETAARVAPHLWLAHVRLAEVLTNVPGREKEASKAARLAVGLAPDRTEPHVVAGAVHLASGRRDEAEDAYLRALAIDPQNTPARDGLARLRPEQYPPASAAEAVSPRRSSPKRLGFLSALPRRDA